MSLLTIRPPIAASWLHAVCVACMMAIPSGVLADGHSQQISADELQQISAIEAQVQQLLEQAIADQHPPVSGRQVQSVSGRQAAMSALEKNLTLRQGKLSDTVADAVLQQARAVFDPVLLLSLSYTRDQVNTRVENAPRFQSATTLNDDGEHVLEIDEAFDPRAPIVVFTEPRDEGFEDAAILASQEPLTGSDEQTTLGAGITQVFPWGGDLEISYSALHQERYFINNPQVFTNNPNPPLNLIGFGSYGRPWVSELLAGLETPLPGTCGFGQHAAGTLNRNRAAAARDASAFETQSLISTTLKSADDGWWNLVEAALAVQAVHDNRVAAEALLASTRRLYDSRSANNYDLSQAELSLAAARQREQQAWSAYVRASDALSRLLDRPAGQLLVPQNFTETLGLTRELPDAGADPITGHPDFQAQQSQNEIARLQRAADQQGLAPDVTLDAQLRLRQSNQVYGYESLSESMTSVFDPDVSTFVLGASFTRPLGNRAAKASAEASDAAARQATLTLQAERQNLSASLTQAEAVLAGARVQLTYRAEASALADSAYERALRQQRRREIKEYELVGLHAQRLSTRLAYISALIAVKKSETALLDARGMLHSHYASFLASGPLERQRLALLGHYGVADWFLPQGESQ